MRQHALVILLIAAGLSGGCERADEDTSRFAAVVVGEAKIPPPPAGQVDLGILKDPSSYTPTSYQPVNIEGAPQAPAAASAGAADGAAPADAGEMSPTEAEIRKLIADLHRALREADVDYVLDTYRLSDIQPLADNAAILYEAAEKTQAVQDALKQAIGEEKYGELEAKLNPDISKLVRVEVLDADHATVAPNILGMALMGSVAPPTMTLVRVDGRWQAQLPEPLTPEQVDQIKIEQQQTMAALDQVDQMIASGQLNAEMLAGMAEQMAAVQAAILEGQDPQALMNAAGGAGADDSTPPDDTGDEDQP